MILKNIETSKASFQNIKRHYDKELNILVIDDNSSINTILVKILELQGYQVKGFTNSVDALDWYCLNKKLIDLVFLDINMPFLDGFECLKKIKNINNDQKVAMMSANDDLKTINYASCLGASEFFSKPFNFEKILDWIDFQK